MTAAAELFHYDLYVYSAQRPGRDVSSGACPVHDEGSVHIGYIQELVSGLRSNETDVVSFQVSGGNSAAAVYLCGADYLGFALVGLDRVGEQQLYGYCVSAELLEVSSGFKCTDAGPHNEVLGIEHNA